jgi:hypothetical protein
MLQNFCIGNLHIFTDDGAICSAPKRQKLMTVFDCPRDGCTKSFTSNRSLENHPLLGDCNYTQDLTAHDKAKVLYGTKVNDLFTNTSAIIIPSETKEGDNYLQQSWALKSKKKRVIFNDDQIKFMKEKFYAGKRKGSKVDPYKAAADMRYLKDGGQFVLKKEEYLAGQQISSYFSRLALKDRNVDQEDYKSAEEEKCKRELKSDILKQLE